MTSYQLQQLLFYIGLALVAIGVLLAAGAFYMFRKFDILDIRDDLSGKKRAEGVAKMMTEQASGRQKSNTAKARRSQKTLAAGQTTGSLDSTGSVAAPSGDVSAKAGDAPNPQQAAASQRPAAKPQATKPASGSTGKRREVAAPIPQLDDPETTVMDGDDVATTVLGETTPDEKQAHEAETADETSKSMQLEDAAEQAADETEAEEAGLATDESAVEPATEAAPSEPDEPEVDMPVTQDDATEEAAPDDFHIVRKIVLTDSVEYVRVERGDSDE